MAGAGGIVDLESQRGRVSVAAAASAWFAYIFLILPSLVIVPMSFGDKDEFQFPPSGISFYLYEQYFTHSTWVETTIQSFVVAVATMIASLVLGVMAAYGIVRGEFPGKKFVTLFLLSPMLVPVIVVALGLYLYFSSLGITGTTLGLVLGHTVHTTPFVIVMAMAGLRHVDPNLEIAGRILGASRTYTIRKITLPLLKPTLIAAGLFAFLLSFDEVVISWFISAVRTQTLPVKMYSSIQWEVSPVLAAISTLLTLLSLVICLAAQFVQRNKMKEEQ